VSPGYANRSGGAGPPESTRPGFDSEWWRFEAARRRFLANLERAHAASSRHRDSDQRPGTSRSGRAPR
jgi:hypothetical protein